MRLHVSAKQVQKNREGIKQMWKGVPGEWIELDTYIASNALNDEGVPLSRAALVELCDGPDGPHNTCGAVGCFAGWSWMYHPYQAWCRRNGVTIACTANLSVYLGLEVNGHAYFTGRDYRCEMSQKKEVTQRINELMHDEIVEYSQEVFVVGDSHDDMVPGYVLHDD